MRESAEHYLDEAARCYRLARGCSDRKLVEIGHTFVAQAMQLGARPADALDEWWERNAQCG